MMSLCMVEVPIVMFYLAWDREVNISLFFCDVFVWKWGPKPRTSTRCYHGNKSASFKKAVFVHPIINYSRPKRINWEIMIVKMPSWCKGLFTGLARFPSSRYISVYIWVDWLGSRHLVSRESARNFLFKHFGPFTSANFSLGLFRKFQPTYKTRKGAQVLETSFFVTFKEQIAQLEKIHPGSRTDWCPDGVTDVLSSRLEKNGISDEGVYE